MTRSVGAIVFPDFELLDLYGPLEMLGMWPEHFTISLISAGELEVASGQGPRALADFSASEAKSFDVLLIPGGMGTRREVGNARLVEYLATAAARSEIVATVCTGAALLAATGLLDGRSATTNKLAFDWVASSRPAVAWRRTARWCEDGKYMTSSGVSAGIDMTLAMIARLQGEAAACQTAKWAEYRWNRDPTDDPFA